MFNYSKIDPEHCEYVQVASIEEILDGKRLHLEIDDIPIVIFNIAGDFYAIGDKCSHDDGPLGDGELTGYKVACPRHGAQFDVRTGEALTMPAVVDIPAYPIKIINKGIEVGIPIR